MLDLDWSKLEETDANGEFAPRTQKTSTSPYAKTERFPCEKCAGTGRYRGVRLHQPATKCFACGGKGYFMTSAADRAKARLQHQTSKARRLAEVQAAFDEQNPDVTVFLKDAARWSSFAASMCEAVAQYGTLTDKQLSTVRSMMAKTAASREARVAERKTTTREVDLSPIRAMFESAVVNGYNRPVYRAAGLIISRASDASRNPGALYVKSAETDEYLGKLLGTVYSGKPAPGLEAIAADPRGEAIKYGQRTGTCSCCGRMLTNEGSIEAGIGPICARKWGL